MEMRRNMFFNQNYTRRSIDPNRFYYNQFLRKIDYYSGKGGCLEPSRQIGNKLNYLLYDINRCHPSKNMRKISTGYGSINRNIQNSWKETCFESGRIGAMRYSDFHNHLLKSSAMKNNTGYLLIDKMEDYI